MLKREFSTQLKKDLKRFKHNKPVLIEFENVLNHLISKKTLPIKYKDHSLSGNFSSFRECHLKPDTLLIYRIDDNLLYLYRVGSHSELFN